MSEYMKTFMFITCEVSLWLNTHTKKKIKKNDFRYFTGAHKHILRQNYTLDFQDT